MSLWTPGGEHEVPRDSQTPAPAAPGDDPSWDDMTPEQQAQAEAMMAEMAEVQQRIAAMPASEIVANHLMGFYELAAIHLSQDPPNFTEARVGIDALDCVLTKMEGRLGENEPTLRQALAQIQMAFVQLSEAASGPA